MVTTRRKTTPVLMRHTTPLDQPRAIGTAAVSSKRVQDRSVLDGLRQSGALKLLFPRDRPHVEAVIVNTAGGITGGDNFEIRATAGVNSALTLTTQAAERAYRAQPGQIGRLTTQLIAEEDAILHWLPQETILYEAAALRRRLRVDLAPSARFLMVEPVLFGRKAMGEDPCQILFEDRVDIRRDGQPLVRDGLTLTQDLGRLLDHPAIANGARAMVSLVWVAPEAQGALEAIRRLIGPLGGASMVQKDTLVLRMLGDDGFALRRGLLPVLDLMTHNALPLCWRL